MPKFLIEREVPNAGDMSQDDLRGISQTSCSVLQEMGPQIQWQQSFVAGDKIYCVYIAPNEELIREHAEKGGFPANKITEVDAVIDPTTAESVPA
jgi:cell division inhibitor SulA